MDIQLIIKMIKPNLFKFIYSRLHKLGIKLIYSVLLMFYAYQSEKTPPWAKRIILGAIAYLLMPIDAIPDLTPFIGFTDDLGVLLAEIATVSVYINAETKEQAKDKMKDWFGK